MIKSNTAPFIWQRQRRASRPLTWPLVEVLQISACLFCLCCANLLRSDYGKLNGRQIMIVEFILGAALVIMTTAALIIWLSSITTGLTAMLSVGVVMTVALLVLMAQTAIGVPILDSLHVVLVISLLVAPIIAIAFADWRRT